MKRAKCRGQWLQNQFKRQFMWNYWYKRGSPGDQLNQMTRVMLDNAVMVSYPKSFYGVSLKDLIGSTPPLYPQEKI